MPDRRTYADRAAYLKIAVSKRRKKMREMVIKYKGGKCVICDYNKYSGSFDLHHLNASEKEFGLSTRGVTRAWKKIKEEADKCVLMCANCHRELHGGITQLPKVT